MHTIYVLVIMFSNLSLSPIPTPRTYGCQYITLLAWQDDEKSTGEMYVDQMMCDIFIVRPHVPRRQNTMQKRIYTRQHVFTTACRIAAAEQGETIFIWVVKPQAKLTRIVWYSRRENP